MSVSLPVGSLVGSFAWDLCPPVQPVSRNVADPNGPKAPEHFSDLCDALSLTDITSPYGTTVDGVEFGVRIFSCVAAVIVLMLSVFGWGQRKSTSLSILQRF